MLSREQLLEINPQFAKFYEISPKNPQETAKSSGNCLSCATTLAQTLMSDPKTPVTPITTKNANYTESELLDENKKIKCKTPDLLLEKIRASAPGSIFVLDIGDHVYNLFKNFDNKIMLLDADLQIFKQINQPEDLCIPVKMILDDDVLKTCPLRDPERKVFDLFHDGEEKRPDIYMMGIAHAAWNVAKEMKENKVKHEWTSNSSTLFAHNKSLNEGEKTPETTLKLGRRQRG